MFLNDPLKHRFGAGMIPDTIGPDDGNGSGFADLQAIGLGPLNSAFSRQPQLFQAPLEVFPRCLADIAFAAALLVRDRANEDMPFNRSAADTGERAFGFCNVIG